MMGPNSSLQIGDIKIVERSNYSVSGMELTFCTQWPQDDERTLRQYLKSDQDIQSIYTFTCWSWDTLILILRLRTLKTLILIVLLSNYFAACIEGTVK